MVVITVTKAVPHYATQCWNLLTSVTHTWGSLVDVYCCSALGISVSRKLRCSSTGVVIGNINRLDFIFPSFLNFRIPLLDSSTKFTCIKQLSCAEFQLLWFYQWVLAGGIPGSVIRGQRLTSKNTMLESTTSKVLVVLEGHDDDDEDSNWTMNFFYLPRSCTIPNVV